MSEATAQVGLVGLAVMGQNLVLNMADHGYRVAVYNRTWSATEAFVGRADVPESVTGCATLAELVAAVERPRRIILLVRAGAATDAVIEALGPLLDEGDVLIDGGNSHYPDTERRAQSLHATGRLFVGSGVSGGEEGARHGPALMPGGDERAWPLIQPLFEAIAAKAEGEPCCAWLGAGGAGHYVKMVHNGIEYGDMQLIAETYDVMRRGLNLDADQMASVFRRWNQGRLESYLIEITGDILAYRDGDGEPLLEQILDAAGQKGTGKWTGISSLELGVPVSLISEAVYARCLSALVSLRTGAQGRLEGPGVHIESPVEPFLADLEQALFAAKVISYAQGFMLLREASDERGWGLNLPAVASLWRGGCIIRSVFLNDIARAFTQAPDLACLALDDYFANALNEAQAAWRRVVSAATLTGIATPGLSSALNFYDGLRTARGPANLLQAQRDYFGGHTYERLDGPRGEFHHTDWTGLGGDVSSQSYNV